MTGPLAPLFAQVRARLDSSSADSGLEATPTMSGASREGNDRVSESADALAALSVIERHVQEMGQQDAEKALRDIADSGCENFTDGDPRECIETKRAKENWCWPCVALETVLRIDDARVALPAREEGATGE